MKNPRVIFKHELSPGETVVKVPIGAETLDVQVQEGKVVAWICGTITDDPREERRFTTVVTGEEFDRSPYAHHVATVQIPSVIPLVFHIFEERVF